MNGINKEICQKICKEFYTHFPNGDYISCVYYVLETLGYDKYGEEYEKVEKFCY